MSDSQVLRAIEHTNLRPEAGPKAVETLCREAVEHGFLGVCVHSLYVPHARAALRGTGRLLASVVGFPLGAVNLTALSVEASEAARSGADEVDMVLPLGLFKEGQYKGAAAHVTAVAGASGLPVKVILETCYLIPTEIEMACNLAEEAGASFVKTSTGFGPAGATVEAVSLMRRTVGNRLGVKASGGIRTLEDARAMLDAGASRLGTSRGVEIARALAADSH